MLVRLYMLILIRFNQLAELSQSCGGVAERLNAPVLKTGMGESPSWVRIPPPPPFIYLTDRRNGCFIYKEAD